MNLMEGVCNFQIQSVTSSLYAQQCKESAHSGWWGLFQKSSLNNNPKVAVVEKQTFAVTF